MEFELMRRKGAAGTKVDRVLSLYLRHTIDYLKGSNFGVDFKILPSIRFYFNRDVANPEYGGIFWDLEISWLVFEIELGYEHELSRDHMRKLLDEAREAAGSYKKRAEKAAPKKVAAKKPASKKVVSKKTASKKTAKKKAAKKRG